MIRRQRKLLIRVGLLCLTLFGAGFLLGMAVQGSPAARSLSAEASAAPSPSPRPGPASPPPSAAPSAAPSASAPPGTPGGPEADGWRLRLVNRDHPLPREYTPDELTDMGNGYLMIESGQGTQEGAFRIPLHYHHVPLGLFHQ